MQDIRIIKTPITRTELKQLASEQFGDVIKAVVDIEQKIMALRGELHIDMEVVLVENEKSESQNVWGFNLYPDSVGENFIEFDSMINLKPSLGNKTRNIESLEIQNKIREIVAHLIIE